MSQGGICDARTQPGAPAPGCRTASAPKRSELPISLLVFAAAVVYLWPLRDFLSFNADEGVTLTMAERILHGQLPYRDFFTFVTPGSPYLMAFFFKLLGTSFLVARSVLLAYAGIFAAVTYWLARRMVGRTASLWAAALLVLGCLPSRFFVLHNWDSTLFALLAVLCAHLALEHGGWAPSFFLGCTTALTVLTEQSKGSGLVLGLALAALALGLSGRNPLRPPVRNLCAGAMGFAIPVSMVFVYFATQHATGAMLDAWLWPLRHFVAKVNHEPYGAPPIAGEALHGLLTSDSWAVRALVAAFCSPMLLISLLPLLVLASTLHAIALRWSAAPSKELDARVLGGCIFLGVFLSVLSTRRADLNHLIYLTPLFLYLTPSIFQMQSGVRLFRRSGPVAMVLLLLSFMGFGLISILPAAKATTMQTRRGKLRTAYRDEVLGYIDENVPPGAHLYVHPYQALYSFMSARENPAHIVFLLPGMNTRDQYDAVVANLAADRTPYVLLNPDFSEQMRVTWPSTPAEALASDPVEAYVLKHYRACRVLNAASPQAWRFYFMVRMDLPCPSPTSKPE